MELHQGDSTFLLRLVHEELGKAEGIGEVGAGKVCIAKDIYHAYLLVIHRQKADTSSRILLWIVCGPEDAGVFCDELHHVLLVIDFLSTSDHIDAQLQQLHAVGSPNTETSGCPLCIGDHQIDGLL